MPVAAGRVPRLTHCIPCGVMDRHQEEPMASKLRHIAISVRDPEAAAKFFEKAFGMTRAGNAQRGVYMTDGIMNVALLNFGDEPIAGFEGQKGVTGLIHFGMWVDSVAQIDKAATAGGGGYGT